MANVASATSELISQPIEQYPRVVTGIYTGAVTTARTSAVELCNVATTLTFVVQSALEVAHGVVAKDAEDIRRAERSRFSQQPVDAQDGVLNARDALLAAMHEAYNDVVHKPRSVLAQRRHGMGQTSLLIRVIGSAPGAGLRPMIGACEAVSLTLQGIRNGMSPDTRNDLRAKYR